MFLNITIDVGTSITKVVYNLDEGSELFLKMDSECISAPIGSLNQFNNKLTNVLPEDSAWISLKKNDSQVYLLGILAKQVQMRKSLKKSKYEDAEKKILGIVGAIVFNHKLEVNELKVNINLLLPYDEYCSQEMLEKSLKKSLKSFYFKGRHISVELVDFTCFVEGYGGFINRVVSQGGIEWLNQRQIVVLMFGHRNIGFLLFKQGALFSADTLNLGFYNFLEAIKNQSIGQDLSLLEQFIPLIGNDLSSDLLQGLVKSKEQKNRKKEISQLKNVIKQMRKTVWSSIQNWLEEKIPTLMDEVIILGGCSQYFTEEINKYFSWGNIYWGEDLASEVAEILPEKLRETPILNVEIDNSLSFRFVDVFGLHKFLKADLVAKS